LNLGEVGNRGGVDCAIRHPVPVVLLPSSQPHQEVCVQGLGGRIEVLPMALVGHRGVLAKLAVDARVGIRLRPVRWVVGDFWGRRLALVGVRHELLANLALVRLGLRGKHKDDYK
jgi:hypothetical protein